MTGKPESERSLRTPIMVDRMEATDHELSFTGIIVWLFRLAEYFQERNGT